MTAPQGSDAPGRRLENKADAIFLRALELDEEQRLVYVEQACVGDVELEQLVERLLEAAFDDSPLLRTMSSWCDARLDAELDCELDCEPELVDGAVIDERYRIVRELGRGGMGVVYLAERADGQFEQTVALKVIHRGAGRGSAERFARERQILARLEDPRIARLLDGGICLSGRPYLVMEYVAGRPIDRYCSEEKLDVERRVSLLVEVCEAVQAAHRQLVVHRDLKPSNILVTDSGQVKLLDFGIAKLLEGGDDSALTQSGGSVMTPQYASPEQFRGDPMTVASDIYQLGLVAYELLVGRRPFELSTASPMEAIRWVCKETPTRPSAAARQQALRRRLAGDLDAIVLRALEKDPAQRYRSADTLREDLERYLGGRPISARPDRLGYRLTKLWRRRRWEISVVVGCLLVVLFFSVSFTLRLAEERDRTRAEAREAEVQRRNAEEVADFLVSLFDASDPLRRSGELPDIREVLDRGAQRIEHELADQPATQARLMLTIGRIYHVLGLYGRARELLEGSLALHQEASEGRALELAESLDVLARVEMALGDPERSFERLETVLELRREAGEIALVVGTLHRMAACRQFQGRWAEAEQLSRRAVGLARELDRPATEMARYLDGLANSLDELGRVDEARRLYREILAFPVAELGPRHPSRAATLSNLAATHLRSGEIVTALPLLEEALTIQELVLGSEHPHWAIMAGNLGNAYREAGRYEDAETVFRRVLELRRRIYGEQHLEVARSLDDLAVLALARGEPATAEQLLRQALEIRDHQPVSDHPDRGRTLVALGRALAELGRSAEAIACLSQAIENTTRALGADHPWVAEPLAELAGIHRRRGELASAETLYRRVVEILSKAEGVRPEALSRAEEALGEVVAERKVVSRPAIVGQ